MAKLNILCLVLLSLLGPPLSAQTNNPVPKKIRPSGLLMELEEFATIPASNNEAPFARINMLREAPHESGRLFVIDLNGFLWVLENGQAFEFLKIRDFTTRFITAPGKGTGFGAFAFHPEFSLNGKFYTTHAELPNSGKADYQVPKESEISMQWVLQEWTIDNTESLSFSGTKRELLRLDYPGHLHGMQDLQFNPTAEPGDADYGKLYLCLGDGGASLHLMEENLQNKSSFLGTIFRIDPLGTDSKNGKYGIPKDNPFIEEDGALPEIYCYGFRNPHRISWDRGGQQQLIIADIGEKNLEEINIGIPGANYGWGKREGTFVYDRSKGRDFVYPLPANDNDFGFTYPVAQYDHDEGLAIVGGYVYRGNLFPQLNGHYIFGDIPSGRVFHVPVEDFQEGSLAEIKELNFIDANRDRSTFLMLTPGDRVDLRFGIDQAGEFYFLSKADGKIRKLKSNAVTSTTELPNLKQHLTIFPNPIKDELNFFWPIAQEADGQLKIYSIASGKLLKIKEVRQVSPSISINELRKGAYLIELKLGKTTFSTKVIKL